MKQILKYLCFLLFISASNTPVLDRVQGMILQGKIKSLILFLGIWGVCLLGLLASLHLKNKRVRVALGILFCINTILGVTYYSIGKHYLSYQDIELLWISRANASDAISFYLNAMLQPILLSVFGMISFSLAPSIKVTFKNRFFYVLTLIPILLLMGVSFVKKGYGTEGMPQQYSPLSIFSLYHTYEVFLPSIIDKREEVQSLVNNKNGTRNIVYIVDESVRSDYLDLNKDRGVTPYLKTQKGRISNFGGISSGNNCSGYSNIILRTGATPKTLTQIGKLPLIWSFAKKAGYKTYYFDAQQTDGILQNFMTKEELKGIDHFVQLGRDDRENADQIFAIKVKEILNGPGKNFIYINKRGAHFPYTQTYPERAAKFMPAMKLGDELGQSKEKLINSYKNSINWTVDGFFKVLLKGSFYKDSVLFYTSDHGQNLMDKGVMTHCNTQDPHAYEGYVPLLVITDNLNKKNKYTELSKKRYNQLTHFHLFGTLISEMGHEDIDERYLSLEKLNTNEQAFTLGSLIPRFGEEVKWHSINSINP